MRKEELRRLKRINATPCMMRMAIDNKLDEPQIIYDYSKHIYNTRYDMFIRCQSRGPYLMISLFFPDEMADGSIYPTYEIYCNPEGHEFITRILENGREIKWSTAKVENLGRVYESCEIGGFKSDRGIKRVWQSYEGKQSIKQFLDVSKPGIEGLMEYQKRSREKNIVEAEARQQKPWDEDMALIPDILPGFERWAKHEAADENFIFYRSIHDENGWCSYCEKEVPLINPVRNKKAKCPCCKKKIIFKLQSKIQRLETKRRSVECIQEIQDGFVIRTFELHSSYRGRSYDNPDWSFIEQERYMCINNHGIKHYTWGLYKNKHLRWCKTERDYYRIYGYKAKLYRKNMRALKRGALKYSAIWLWKELPCTAAEYLYREQGAPVVEMLARIGMFKLAKEIMYARYDETLLDQSATELPKMLKIDKSRLKRLKDMGENINSLKWLQLEKIADTIWPDNVIADLGKNHIIASDLFFLPKPIKPVKIYNYLLKQQRLSGEALWQVICTWRDYYNLAEQNKWNVESPQIGWPKDLKYAHEQVVIYARGEELKVQISKLEKKWPKVNKILPKLKKYEYQNEEYAVIAPGSIEDIVKEGIALNHCIDHADFYYDRIQKREAYIFFLRKTKSLKKAWYTLEVEASGNIRQKRTTGDNQTPELNDAIPFLQDFMKHFRKVMTESEKKQGKAADERRKEEYKKLREEGKRVWRGKLAGQLLADVLEADFMEAI